jgi:pre-mRNA-splicing factor ISY1
VKKRCRYAIYKQIEANSYYGYINDEDGILEKVEWPVEEDM